MYIGKNDAGKVVGIQKSKKLLEVIPNKITNTMEIVANVNLLFEDSLEYIEIIVEKYPSLISYHGKYYYRSGSTIKTIIGKELDKKLLKAQGKTWDRVALPKITVQDLKPDAIELFKEKAAARGRLTEEDVSVSDDTLIENLYLKDEDGFLVRAAMLVFYKKPEKWITGFYIKIGILAVQIWIYSIRTRYMVC